MQIASVECIRLTYRYSPEEVWRWAGGTYHGWTAGFVRLADREGRVGIGEIGDGLNVPEIVPGVVEHFAPLLVGQDPTPIRGLVQRLYRSGPGWARRGLAISVLSGIESALFDLVGKALGVPAHVLLGGATRTRLPVYASGGLEKPPEELAQELASYVDRGFSAVKIRIGYGIEQDVALVGAAREAVGKHVRLMLDLGGSYLPERQSVIEVAFLARQLEPFEPFWLEEPLHPDDLAGHRRLRSMTSIPIAAGENTRTLHEARQLIEAEAVDILQTDAVHTGGMLEQLEIGRLAAHYGVTLAPHTWGSAPGLMANLHAFASIPTALIAEYSQAANPLRDRIMARPLQFESGHLILPDLPGLGVELSEDLIAEFPYDPAGSGRLTLEEP